MELAKVKKIHFIGASGVSMSALAELMRHRGFEVSGCDITTGGHRADHITRDINL
ncbi:UDP-N-acetylmuramate--L-alanine ligase, partial [Candidatus Berkelbacteria bacterium]|nr:UDP-N-acetylmuramate--L-alanine ligase [Candidatus Berkelbacteria bacterium]